MQIIDEVEEIFLGMGYKIADGPEVEKAIYNFDKLNTPKRPSSKRCTRYILYKWRHSIKKPKHHQYKQE